MSGVRCLTTSFGLFLKWYIGLFFKVCCPTFLCKMESLQVLAGTQSRYLAAKLNDKSAQTMNQAAIKSLGKIDAGKVKTMTFDNGFVFEDFKGLEKALGMKTYFAQPYHSWKRGTGENTNGLLRQFFPKMTYFDEIADTELDRKDELLNNRPRKCLSYTVGEITSDNCPWNVSIT